VGLAGFPRFPNVLGQRCQGAPSEIPAASTARQPIFAGAFAVTGSGQGSCVVRVCSPKEWMGPTSGWSLLELVIGGLVVLALPGILLAF
jgi:hypothetical protein